jgi:hypothetical protein
MVDEDYFVQVTYRRTLPTGPSKPPETPKPPDEGSEWPIPSAEAEEISAELTGQHPTPLGSVPATPDDLVASVVPPPPTGKLVPCKGGFMRVLTPEEDARELSPSRDADHPRVRAMFDLIEKSQTKQALPDGVRVRQGDLFAPGLVITENPFPDWFKQALQVTGQFEWDNGCVSYTKMVTGKPQAERWAAWVIEILEAERKAALLEGRKPLADTTEVMVREDHRALMNDIFS